MIIWLDDWFDYIVCVLYISIGFRVQAPFNFKLTDIWNVKVLFNNSFTVWCYELWFDNWRVFFWMQHSIDYWLWADLIAPESQRLLKNVVRVYRQEDADLFYIPFFTTISYFLLEKQQCKSLYRVWVPSEGLSQSHNYQFFCVDLLSFI